MRIPDPKTCFDIIRQMAMLENIIDHSVMVCRTAAFLADHLSSVCPDLDTDLVVSSALLHDITKTRSFKTGELHSETGGDFLKELGYDEVGSIVRQHVMLDNFNEHATITEVEIVNYSDKRVLHDRIVSLDQRMAYILERYGNTREKRGRLEIIWEESAALERKLFRPLAFVPEHLSRLVEEADDPVAPLRSGN